MPNSIFTAITFSPVTEFIEKTRKLRDLYGSSFILSYLAESVCHEAQQQLGVDAVISPALLNITMGTPDQIVIQGDFSEKAAKGAFMTAWGNIVDTCRDWVCQSCHDWIDTAYQQWVANHEWHPKASRTLPWNRDWQHWKNHAWEVFWVQSATIPEVLDALAEEERNRNWIGINWMGESSTLSGVDAIAWPGLGLKISAKQRRISDADTQIRAFFQDLNLKIGEAILEDDLSNHRSDPVSRLQVLADRYNVDLRQPDHPKYQDFRRELAQNLGEAIVTNREQLSIPELIKRLFTLRAVAQTVSNSEQLQQELPDSFKDVNLWKTDQPMGWFRGDGDRAGQYIREITQGENAVEHLHRFSHQMRQWGQSLKQNFDQRLGRIIFAGGDDFLGLFYPSNSPIAALNWLYQFKENTWHRTQDSPPAPKPITPSLGFVWASPKVPQRDVLQHCELAERNAKDQGRDRLALRVLFNSGTHLEWICPWQFLPVLQDYRDRSEGQNWAHIYNDIAVLDARYAFESNQAEVAIGLLCVYFKLENNPDNSHWKDDNKEQFYQLMNAATLDFNQDGWWNLYEGDDRYDSHGRRTLSGILGDRQHYLKDDTTELDEPKAICALNDWIVNLAKVGFHLCSNS